MTHSVLTPFKLACLPSGWTVSELAERTGASAKLLQQVASGTLRDLPDAVMRALSRVLQVNVAPLIRLPDGPLRTPHRLVVAWIVLGNPPASQVAKRLGISPREFSALLAGAPLPEASRDAMRAVVFDGLLAEHAAWEQALGTRVAWTTEVLRRRSATSQEAPLDALRQRIQHDDQRGARLHFALNRLQADVEEGDERWIC